MPILLFLFCFNLSAQSTAQNKTQSAAQNKAQSAAQSAAKFPAHNATKFPAQDFREAKIFVLPIAGEGTADANSYFYKQLTYEVTAQFCAVVKSKRNSDYILKGMIEPLVCRHSSASECYVHSKIDHKMTANTSNANIFYLELINTADGKAVSWQYILYNRITNEITAMVSEMVYNMLSSIPDIVQEDKRNSWLFAGGAFTWAPRIYEGDDKSVYMLNFGFGLEAEYQFLNFMAVGAGLQFAQDWIILSNDNEYRDLIMEIPVALKLVFKPYSYFLIEPYGGVLLNLSFMHMTEPSMLSWFAGLQFGVKAGPGFITIDPRLTMDFDKSRLSSSAKDELEYYRTMIQIAVGYKFGFFQKKKKADY